MSFTSNSGLLAVTSSSEVGMISDCNAASLPTGYKYCNGETLNTSEFPELAAALGESGATFDLPFLVNGKSYSMYASGGSGDVEVTLTAGGGTLDSDGVDGEIYVYQKENGEWRAAINFVANVSTTPRTSAVFRIENVVFKNETNYYQAVSFIQGISAVTYYRGYTNPNSGVINVEHSNSSSTLYTITCDVELDSKPSFVLDNSPTNYDVYKVIRYAPKTALNATATSTGSISATGSVNENAGIDTYFCTNAADTGDITITLPSAAGLTGREFTFIKTDSTTNDIIIDGDGSETLNGYASITLDCQYARIKIVSDGSNWQVKEHFFTDNEYSEAGGDFTVTGTDWSTTTAVAKAIRGLDGGWSITLDIIGAFSGSKASTSTTLTVSGTLFRYGSSGVCSASDGLAGNINLITAGSGGIILYTTGSQLNRAISITCPLQSKPSFVA